MSIYSLDQRILLTLVDLSRFHGNTYCCPSQKGLLRHLENFQNTTISRRTLNRRLKILLEDGFIERVRMHRRGRGGKILFSSTLYKFKGKVFNELCLLKNRIPWSIPKPKKIYPSKRGETWKSHPSEKKLWRSSKTAFNHLLYRAQVPKDPEKFPWCQVGIKSLMKHTGYSHCQVTRALAQLERFKRIKRIVEGNEYQGASKYLVFFTHEMSRAHSYKSRHPQKD